MVVLEPAGPTGLPAPRPVQWPILVIASSATVMMASACVWPMWSADPTIAAPTVLFAGALVAAGVILRGEPGQHQAARALLLAGMLWPLTWLGAWGPGLGAVVALLVSPLSLVLTAWAIFRYPDPQQVSDWERWFLRSLVLWIIVGRISVVVTSPPAGPWSLALFPQPNLNHVLTDVSAAGEALLALPFLGQWFRRVRRVRGLDRRLMGPVVVAAVVAGSASAAIPTAAAVHLPEPAMDLIFSIQCTLLLAVPIAFAVAALRRRLTSTVIADLVDQLRADPTPENVEHAFQHVLADPGLRVHYWSAELMSYVDREGQVFGESPGTGGLVLPMATAADEPLAVIHASPALRRYPDLMAAAVCVGALAIENAQLQVVIRAQLAQVRASRARIMHAGLIERQALERDLHTGALTRILGLIDVISGPENRAPTPLDDVASYATGQLGLVATELQHIARGLHPAALSTAGLVEAVRGMGQAQPVPVAVDLPRRPFPSGVEVAAYYVISEAITNAVRHAQATKICVRGVDTGTTLLITVQDDGRGGADVSRGTGLLGLSERLQALDGDLSVLSPPGEGTLLMAEIPCE